MKSKTPTIKVNYKATDVSEEVKKMRVNDAFKILFDEVLTLDTGRIRIKDRYLRKHGNKVLNIPIHLYEQNRR